MYVYICIYYIACVLPAPEALAPPNDLCSEAQGLPWGNTLNIYYAYITYILRYTSWSWLPRCLLGASWLLLGHAHLVHDFCMFC